MSKQTTSDLLARLETLTPQEMKRYLVQELTRKKLGLVWEADLIERDAALNENMVFPELVADQSLLDDAGASGNFIIEGDNFDSLRMLKATHAGKIRVILIDPPYNTGNKDWVYNDSYMKKDDRWKHSTWLEFMYQRMVLARDLLTPDGVIMICINDDNRSRLELMMDEVMPGRRVGSFVWKTRSGSNDETGARLSNDHEHVLVYANQSFAFSGEYKDLSQYKNPDDDPRGPWKTGDLTKSHTYLERRNGYYPIQNPATGVWYPCNPSRVWAFASENIVKDTSKLRAKTMEQYIREEKVIFPDPASERVEVWDTKEELLDAIKRNDVPIRPKTKTPLLTESLPDLDFWVGKPVGFGRPWFKRHVIDLQSEVRPLSSWIRGASEVEALDEFTIGLVSQRSGTGEHSVNEVMGFNAFPFPKPISLIKNLLTQTARPGDTVLDFFAGSGTTGHAVLALNAEDGGNRKFILCSSTEATPKEPAKNLCRDVCAERIRRVINGYGKTEGLGGDFAYLTLTLLEEADLLFDATPEHAYAILCIRETGRIRQPDMSQPAWPVVIDEHAAIVVCPALTDDSIASLSDLGASRLVVYTDRPERLQEVCDTSGIEVAAYSLEDALRWGQMARQRDIATTSPLDAEVAQ
ncbi:site-specific DNA-methyltransferase [Halomonas faecis]|jgi:adenine-specific DNA-methyltransferase|uniref:site-specific DNA-methyltransferase n=1 Tax=Halomonas faecis TaxID=1562110 RepID=UPI0013D30F5C|nr:site-specific DNA-methyltransferase [Halomonas faecis]